ncbi:DUF5011 domain-containing protein [Cohnella sp. CFH 77786]|uniref:GLUG motif-containing protein n=1 Tax=Cohnella sp. CFH 77786 TaxID=2662265 RepID=UPI001C60C487|nr:GLUG motif-containing protein [Cohnella sp. CFH 77786]MBW5445776.1 DUF5011 domain-containing protein [Cohnella sp. CFH 77786]
MKKTISFILMLMLVIQTLSMSVWTMKVHASMSGGGTSADPYTILTVQDLSDIRNNMSAHYKLGADIDLAGYDYGDGGGWMPIGTINNPFIGTLDGNGYEIRNLTINRSSQDYVGLFGYIYNANLTDIRLLDVNVSGHDFVGGLAGVNNFGSTIQHSYSTGSVNGLNYVGVLIGNHSGGTILDSYATGSASGDTYVGGLAGEIDGGGTVQNSYAISTVNGNQEVGGLVGSNIGLIENSYATGSVSGNQDVGGLAGRNYGGSTIQNSYATGDVTGGDVVGGLVGMNDGGVRVGGIGSISKIANSYATGRVTGSGTLGGLVAINVYGTSVNSYWNTEASGQSVSSTGIGKTTAEMKFQSTYTGLDFTNVWGIREGETYPYLLAYKPELAAVPLAATMYNLSSGQDEITVTGTVRDGSIGDQVTVNYVVKDSSNATVTSVTYSVYADGSEQSIGRTIPIAGLSSGIYTLNISAEDTNHPAIAATPLAFTVDATPPSVGFGTNGSESWAQSASTTVTVADSINGVDASTLAYAWTTDTGVPTSGWTSFASGATLKQSAVDGDWYLHIRAGDTAGNIGDKVSNRFRLDNTAPVITLIGSSSMHMTAGGTYTEEGATATDTGGSGVAGPVAVNAKAPGTYTLRYNVSDLAGNTAVEVTRTVTVDAAPQPSLPRSDDTSAPFASRPVIDLGGTPLDPADIDTSKPSVTLDVVPRDGAAVVSIPASILTSLEGKNAAFLIEIRNHTGAIKSRSIWRR